MNLLLDTHAFIWFIAGDTKLSNVAREHIEDSNNVKILSIASCWEMSIKSSLGRLKTGHPFDDFIAEQLDINGFDLLDISLGHLNVLIKLPYHHKDPFDRLLIAQAYRDNLTLVTNDKKMKTYDIKTIW